MVSEIRVQLFSLAQHIFSHEGSVVLIQGKDQLDGFIVEVSDAGSVSFGHSQSQVSRGRSKLTNFATDVLNLDVVTENVFLVLIKEAHGGNGVGEILLFGGERTEPVFDNVTQHFQARGIWLAQNLLHSCPVILGERIKQKDATAFQVFDITLTDGQMVASTLEKRVVEEAGWNNDTCV